MRKLLNKPWFVGLMSVAALAFVAHSVFSGGTRFGLGAVENSAVAGTEAEQSTDETGRTNIFAVVRNLQLPAPMKDPFAIRIKVDPTVEKVVLPDTVESVHLSAVWTQEGNTLVVINDRICEKGDEIGRIKIDAVTRDGVWLTHWKGRDFVRVGGSFTLNTPAGKTQRVASSL